MEIYNIKLVWKNIIKKRYKNPFKKSTGIFIRVYNVTLTKKYSSNISDDYDCKVTKNNRLIYKFTMSIRHTIDDAIRITPYKFNYFKDFDQFVKFIINEVLNEHNGSMRIIYNVYDTDYSLRLMGDNRYLRMICYHYGQVAEVELSSNYNRKVGIYEMIKGEYIEQPYNYVLNGFEILSYYGNDKKAIELLEKKRKEVLDAICICQSFIQFSPLDYDIV